MISITMLEQHDTAPIETSDEMQGAKLGLGVAALGTAALIRYKSNILTLIDPSEKAQTSSNEMVGSYMLGAAGIVMLGIAARKAIVKRFTAPKAFPLAAS